METTESGKMAPSADCLVVSFGDICFCPLLPCSSLFALRLQGLKELKSVFLRFLANTPSFFPLHPFYAIGPFGNLVKSLN